MAMFPPPLQLEILAFLSDQNRSVVKLKIITSHSSSTMVGSNKNINPNHARKNNMIWTNENTLDLSSLCIEKTESGISPNLSNGYNLCNIRVYKFRGMWLYSN
jgi:hypothetical protein